MTSYVNQKWSNEDLACKDFARDSFVNCTFANCDFFEADFTDSKLVNCTFKNCDFVDCNFTNSSLINCQFRNCDFDNSNIITSKLSDGKFTNCNFEAGSNTSDDEGVEDLALPADDYQPPESPSLDTIVNDEHIPLRNSEPELPAVSDFNFGGTAFHREIT